MMDTVQINDLVKRTEINWGKLSEETYSGIHLDFTVIDMNGMTCYQNSGSELGSYQGYINDAILHDYLLIDVVVENDLVGKVIIHNDLFTQVNKERGQLRYIIIYIYVGFIVIAFIYYLYLERKVFRPFRILKRFAASIASGNLDVPILMDRQNAFGAFTESFDLMREALKTARQNEYLANKSKKELVASLSHDIKNPVASIKAICETMALTSQDRRIDIIRLKAEQIDTLINDMFQSTLEELGELKVTPEVVSSSFMLEIIDNINYNSRIHVISSLPECLIICDKLRLNQIIDNLVGNSIKYANTDIHISFELGDKSLMVYVKDFGKGIPQEEIPLVWDKYYRGTNATKKDGAGLGLYLSKLFIEKMDGQIECYNEPDGFVVKVDLRLEGIK